MDEDQLLNDPEIREFIASHQGEPAERVKRAAALLKNKDDALRALKKILPALGKNAISIFFSYKKKDEAAAKEIVDIFRDNAEKQLKITYMADYPENCVGRRWREQIRNDVLGANWFILLIPDLSEDWDWCLFETGLFEAQFTSSDHLICLHHPDTKLPNPIEGYQAVPATVPEVEKFLEWIFQKENPIPGMEPIKTRMKQQTIIDIAKKIVDAIRPPIIPLSREIFEPWITIKIENLVGLKSKDDLDQALVRDANKSALDLFDFDQKPGTFGKLRDGLPSDQKDDRWRDELFEVIKKIIDGRKFNPIQAVLRAKNGKLFRPVACAVDRLGRQDGPIDVFHVTFSLEVSAVDDSSMPKNLSLLACYLRFAFSFHWEVLEQFSHGPLTEDDVERLRNIQDRIRQNASSRGIRGVDPILELFSGEQVCRIQKMYMDWYQVSNPKRTGELDIAIKTKDVQKIPQILSPFIPASQEFLEMAAEKFAEMVTGSPQPDS